MTLKNSLLISFAAITLFAAAAEAYIVPGGSRPGPAPIPDVGPGFPGDFGPGGDFGPAPIPAPGYPGDDFGNGGGYGRQERKVIYLNRRVNNETLHLRQLAGIGENYRGYVVESVEAEFRSSGYNTEVILLTDGRREESVYSPQGSVLLRPQYRAVLGEDIRTLQLEIRGNAQLESVTVNLREQDSYNPPGRPERTIDVPLYVNRRLYGNDRLDLGMYLDMNRYRGYRIQAIEIDANAVYNVALMDLLINGFNQGQTIQVDRYGRRQTVYPQNAVIGQSASSIVLYTRGDLDVRGVTLKLSRR
ncbi:hypothetical protein [Bdellovibrio bacteriovorus]|uniref:hypothetical protein n=1 Tax=Bdellovibrio bacteriovorus TaxID=959 RepID=UPI0035A5F427